MKVIKVIPYALIVAMLMIIGCGKKVLENQSDADENMQSSIQSQPVVAEATNDTDAQVQLPRPEGNAAYSDDMVFFEFDSDMLTPEAQAVLQAKAQWIKNNPSVVRMIIEGHCDSRGTDAYNMALGERRAETVKNYLIDLGVDVGILETQSYGEEKPVIGGDEEGAWSQNRRASFVIN